VWSVCYVLYFLCGKPKKYRLKTGIGNSEGTSSCVFYMTYSWVKSWLVRELLIQKGRDDDRYDYTCVFFDLSISKVMTLQARPSESRTQKGRVTVSHEVMTLRGPQWVTNSERTRRHQLSFVCYMIYLWVKTWLTSESRTPKGRVDTSNHMCVTWSIHVWNHVSCVVHELGKDL